MPPDGRPQAPRRLDSRDPEFEAAFQALLDAGRDEASQVDAAVAAIIARVRTEGDAALVDLTQRFDRHVVTPGRLAIPEAEIAAAIGRCLPRHLEALRVAAARIRAYHERQMPADADWIDETGIRLGWRWRPIDAVGLYVPGGTASYPSSVLMNAIPARVAGVERLVMTVPTPDGVLNPLVLAAADLAGITEIYRFGGAQAIAALAYGTETIRRVDKIVGPGNAYVADAKRQVFGQVGIDSIAGPSEIVVVADDRADPAWIAADLLSQAEHDASSQAILITDSAAFADAVGVAAERHLNNLSREAIARASWCEFGALIVVEDLAAAAPLVDRLAPEHVELAVEEPEPLFALIRHAGAVFLGRHTPEALGDYVGGPNHVLPTSRAARYASGLGVADFLKRTSLLGATPSSFGQIARHAATLAEAEGLGAHALSVEVRLGSNE